jgi:hypothetical protein
MKEQLDINHRKLFDFVDSLSEDEFKRFGKQILHNYEDTNVDDYIEYWKKEISLFWKYVKDNNPIQLPIGKLYVPNIKS